MEKVIKLKARAVYEKSGEYDYNMEFYPESDVKNGSWVLITRTVPVEERVRPMLYGIYWGIPHDDRYDRQCCKVHITEDVVLLNHEYTILTDENVEEYRNEGWLLKESGAVERELNMELIESGRALSEEEREAIWAMQLDGLTEEQACEEYFLARHTDYNNYTICYLPTNEIQSELIATFGTR